MKQFRFSLSDLWRNKIPLIMFGIFVYFLIIHFFNVWDGMTLTKQVETNVLSLPDPDELYFVEDLSASKDHPRLKDLQPGNALEQLRELLLAVLGPEGHSFAVTENQYRYLPKDPSYVIEGFNPSANFVVIYKAIGHFTDYYGLLKAGEQLEEKVAFVGDMVHPWFANQDQLYLKSQEFIWSADKVILTDKSIPFVTSYTSPLMNLKTSILFCYPEQYVARELKTIEDINNTLKNLHLVGPDVGKADQIVDLAAAARIGTVRAQSVIQDRMADVGDTLIKRTIMTFLSFSSLAALFLLFILNLRSVIKRNYPDYIAHRLYGANFFDLWNRLNMFIFVFLLPALVAIIRIQIRNMIWSRDIHVSNVRLIYGTATKSDYILGTVLIVLAFVAFVVILGAVNAWLVIRKDIGSSLREG